MKGWLVKAASVSSDKKGMKKLNKGTTGLTQKEAIFQIIIGIAGDLYRPGIDLKPLLWEQTEHQYGRTRSASCPFERIVQSVYDGLSDGSIPSKLKSTHERREYASRIVHYWLKHDRRLNGGRSATRMAKARRNEVILLERISTDPFLKSLKSLLKVVDAEEDRQEIRSYIIGRTFTLILETYDIDLEELPKSLYNELRLYSPEIPRIEVPKKTA